MVRMNISITLAPLIASQGKHSISSFFAPEHATRILFKKDEQCGMADVGTRIGPNMHKPEATSKLLKPQVSTESRDAQGLGETFLFNLSDWFELYEVV